VSRVDCECCVDELTDDDLDRLRDRVEPVRGGEDGGN